MIRLGLFLCSVLFAGWAGATPQSMTPPRIAALPVNQSVNQGQKATLTPSVTGSAPFADPWKKAGVDLPGAPHATFAVEAARGAERLAHVSPRSLAGRAARTRMAAFALRAGRNAAALLQYLAPGNDTVQRAGVATPPRWSRSSRPTRCRAPSLSA